MSELYTIIFTIVEIVLILVIVLIQTLRGIKAGKKIKELQTIVPKKDLSFVEKFDIPFEVLKKKNPSSLLTKLSFYKLKIDDKEVSPNKENIISLIQTKKKVSPVFDKILTAINVYLLRNKGATTDFNLIKDITERHIEMEEEEINQTTTTPLYLGLMGTILGVIFGLINFVVASSNGDDFEIKGFLIGVSIAMFASVYGLFWTVLNSNFRYKKAIRIVEDAKNDFYTFVQTELLPVLSLSESSGFYAFNANLMKFNEDFTINIDRLSGLLHKNHDAIERQGEILENLDNIDLNTLVNTNVTILDRLSETTKDLSKFNEYVDVMTASLAGTTKLSGYFMSLLEKTNNFEELAEKLDKRVELNSDLLEFLKGHFQILKDRGLLITDTVKNVDDILVKSLENLREHSSNQIQTIKEVIIREEDLMEKTLAKNRGQLANLSVLNDLSQKSDELKKELTSKLERNETTLIAILEELKKAQTSNDDENTKIENLKTEVYDKLRSNGEVLISILEELKKSYTPNDNENIKIENLGIRVYDKLELNGEFLKSILEELKKGNESENNNSKFYNNNSQKESKELRIEPSSKNKEAITSQSNPEQKKINNKKNNGRKKLVDVLFFWKR